MARTRRPDLSSITARRRLAVGGRYAVRIRRGVSLIYRKDRGRDPVWYVRARVEHSARQTSSGYRFGRLGGTDDEGQGTGLSYAEAFEVASRWRPRADGDSTTGALTVAAACARYLEWLAAHGRGAAGAATTIKAHVLPTLGSVSVADLTTEQLRGWHEQLATAPARLRGHKVRATSGTDDERRARRATANRIWTTLRAALNRAWEDGRVPSRDAWGRVKPFRLTARARTEFLDTEEIRRLLNSCAPDFRRLVEAAIHTGMRLGELVALTAADFRPEVKEHGAVYVAKSKSGRDRFVFLSAEGGRFFGDLVLGRAPDDLLLVKADGAPWNKSEQFRPMRAACASAGLRPMGFHQLRHSYASAYAMNGGSLLALAKQLGHSTTRMVELHYSHLSDSWRSEDAANSAPRLMNGPAQATRSGIKAIRWKTRAR